MGNTFQGHMLELTDDALKRVMETRFKASRDEIEALIRRKLAGGSCTIAELVQYTIEQSYWRGAVDATEMEVPKGPADDKTPSASA